MVDGPLIRWAIGMSCAILPSVLGAQLSVVEFEKCGSMREVMFAACGLRENVDVCNS